MRQWHHSHNGGCGEGRLCTTVDAPSCKDGECCSPVNVTCQGNVEQFTA